MMDDELNLDKLERVATIAHIAGTRVELEPNDLHALLARIRELEADHDNYAAVQAGDYAYLQELKLENTRLREALKEVIGDCPGQPYCIKKEHDIARRALEE